MSSRRNHQPFQGRLGFGFFVLFWQACPDTLKCNDHALRFHDGDESRNSVNKGVLNTIPCSNISLVSMYLSYICTEVPRTLVHSSCVLYLAKMIQS